MVTIAAAIETARVRPETEIDCGSGSIRLFGRTIRDHKSYDILPVSGVLAKSSNVGSINIAMRLGDDLFYKFIRGFGFGTTTGVRLPHESSGVIRPTSKWIPSSIGSVAMGHEISATTLQLATACSVIANGGRLMKPRILLSEVQPDGERLTTAPEELGRPIRPETAITMRRMLEGVVLDGTGRNAKLAGWTSGGKTGTAQIFDLKERRYTHTYNASFLGFAPLRDPKIVIAVTLNGARKYGGTVAAPAFQRIATESLRLLEVSKDSPIESENTLLAKADTDEEDGAYDLPLPAFVDQPDDFFPEENELLNARLMQTSSVSPITLRPAAYSASSDKRPGSAGRPTPAISDISQIPNQREPNKDVPEEETGRVAIVLETAAVPDFQGKPIREVLQLAAKSGLKVEIHGRGIASQQHPPAGSRIPSSGRVHVVFRR
jgi:cell division protein FtsI (penicillin-binding protein 3)